MMMSRIFALFSLATLLVAGASCTADTFAGPIDDSGLGPDGDPSIPDSGNADSGADAPDAGRSPDAATDAQPDAITLDAPADAPAMPDASIIGKRVFVTAGYWGGNFGGLSGADAKCQSAANAANLTGTWRAWLSSTTTSAASRLTHSALPYRLVDGTLVAANWTDLVSGAHDVLIDETETGKVLKGRNVWTGTAPDGSAINCSNSPSYTYCTCSDWTAGAGNYGSQGASDLPGGAWTNYANGASTDTVCTNSWSLYCFEQ